MSKKYEDYSTAELIGVIIGVLVAIPVVLFFGGWLVMICWNNVMPAVFDLPVLTFWNGFWMNLLAMCLFGHGSSSSPKD